MTRRSLRPVKHRYDRPSDIVRQAGVVVAVAFAIVCAVIGVGLVGGIPIKEAQGGALDADGSFLAPGRPAFGIWSVIYLGLIAYAVWQAAPSQRAVGRHRWLGWWIAGTAVLNGLWLVASQVGPLWSTVVMIVLLLVALALTFRRAVITKEPQSSWLDAFLIDGVTGLHLGWVSVATVANVAALLTDLAPNWWAAAAPTWAIAGLVVVLLAGLVTAGMTRWRVTPALAMAWGCLWIGIERLVGEPYGVAAGVTALVVAGLLVVVPCTFRVVAVLREGGD